VNAFLVRLTFAAIAVALILAPIAFCIGGCGGTTKPPVDVAKYEAEALVCVNREDTTACRADRPACTARIESCRAEARARNGITTVSP
jgi:hypothetical protein